MLSILSVAALTPPGHRLRVVDEQIEDVPWEEDFDLVGITVMTATAPRAYALCRRFGEKGVPVVLGGFHPTFNVDEALENADAVVTGPAGGAWERVVSDAAAGRLQRVYRGSADVEVPMALPRHLLKQSGYVSVNTCCATLGCRNECAFCSVTSFYDGKRYRRDVDAVVAHLKSFDAGFFMFMDDNLTQDRGYAMRLFEAIEPVKKKWAAQVSVEIADDVELLERMRRSGCVGVFIGLESFSENALCSQNKTIRSPRFYKEAVRVLHEHGMVVEAGLIFGFDSDAPEVFESTLAMLDDVGADAMQASILTPLPGTRLYRQMRDRIADFDWEHYDYKWAVFEPALMSRQDLQGGLEWINKRFYSPWRILKRLARWLTMPSGLSNFHIPLLLNVAYWGRQFQFGVRGYNPACTRARGGGSSPRVVSTATRAGILRLSPR